MGDFFSLKKSGDVAVISFLKSEITMYEIEVFKKEFSEIIDKEKNVLANFGKLEFISSLVLATLVFILKKVKDKNGKLKFCGLKGKVKEVFEVTDLDKVFEIYPAEAEAISKFSDEGVKA